MPTRSINKNGYGEQWNMPGFTDPINFLGDQGNVQWDMPGFLASGSTSQINPGAVNIAQSLDAIKEVTNGGGAAGVGPGTVNLGLNKGADVTTPIISAVKTIADTTGDKPVISVPPKDVRFKETGLKDSDIYDPKTGNFISEGMPGSTSNRTWTMQTTQPNLIVEYDAQKKKEDDYLFQRAPGNIFNKTTGRRWSETMTQENKWAYDDQVEAENDWLEKAREKRFGTPGVIELMPGTELPALAKKEIPELTAEEIRGLSPAELEAIYPGGVPGGDIATKAGVPADVEVVTDPDVEVVTDPDKLATAELKNGIVPDIIKANGITQDRWDRMSDSERADAIKAFSSFPTFSGVNGGSENGGSVAIVLGDNKDGIPIVTVAGSTVLASEDDWTQDAFQSAWTEVQSGGGVPSWAIRTVKIPQWGVNPNDKTGDLIETTISEISPQTQLLLDENARLAGIRQTSESQRLGQYASILQNPRAAAAMRIMEQMGLGGIAQLLGTPQAQAAQPFQLGSGPYIGSDTPEITGGIPSTAMAQAPMTPEQLRLQEMWGGGMIPTTGFLSGADPDRRAISQVLQQIAGFSPEQTFQSSVGVTPGVSPGYQIPRLLAMRR